MDRGCGYYMGMKDGTNFVNMVFARGGDLCSDCELYP